MKVVPLLSYREFNFSSELSWSCKIKLEDKGHPKQVFPTVGRSRPIPGNRRNPRVTRTGLVNSLQEPIIQQRNGRSLQKRWCNQLPKLTEQVFTSLVTWEYSVLFSLVFFFFGFHPFISFSALSDRRKTSRRDTWAGSLVGFSLAQGRGALLTKQFGNTSMQLETPDPQSTPHATDFE